ncbi:putative glycolipid-binding domain-containing protein [Phytoactinopolyspora limicola]|uniref:putative glycolipid-binding domain-containing protein n=1 Tax=Phytoactinopolyspora limicola TaxID=2715536 RepID=UPI00140BD5B0|nr:putative glycolipid-binding domain-containing protein [Phytoactinopolyspora limicola]
MYQPHPTSQSRLNRELLWTPHRWPGAEHLSVHSDGHTITADGVIIAAEARPTRIAYEINCDTAWRTWRLTVQAAGEPPLALLRDDTDGWKHPDGTPRPDLAGCVDVDIALTPFTNTLPIRRLGLDPGQSVDIRAVYVQFYPHLSVTTSNQRYTRLDHGAGYRYESGDFRADLQVDSDGVVTEYPGLWTLSTTT